MPVFAGGELNGWMFVGFVLATGAVIGNDSLQTLGTYISSNHQTTPKGGRCSSACTAVVLLLGWFLNNGDLGASGGVRSIVSPADPFTWVYVLPPVVALLTRWGAPLSTSFLVLCSFQPARSAPCWRRRWSAMHRLQSGAFSLRPEFTVCCWNAGCVFDQSLG